MIPIVKKKDYESKHGCVECGKNMDGETVIEFLFSPSYGGNYRFMHISCWLKHEQNEQIMEVQRDN
jgi:hypothetical protein